MKKKIVSFAFVLVLLLSMMLIALTTTSVDANSSEIEIYYDNNASNPGGLGGSLPSGLAVNFTTPSEEYWILKRVKFYGMRWANESYDSMPFYVEVWDKNKNELLHIAYKYSDYFKNYDSKWVTVDIPDVLVKDDFFVCIFPNMIYNPSGPSPHMNIGFNNDPPISNRSYRVRMDDNSMEWQIPGNLFIRAIVGEPIIVPDDYPTIQEAINAANPGDTIYVKTGTYHEDVVVYKSLTLQGENRNTTIIDGGKLLTVVYLVANNVDISGFTIQNSGSWGKDSGINMEGVNGCTTNDNILINNSRGIRLENSSNNSIYDNLIDRAQAPGGSYAGHTYGIALCCSSTNNIIASNTIINATFGMSLMPSAGNNTIADNVLINIDGLYIYGSDNNTITNNTIERARWLEPELGSRGILLDNCDGNIVTNNTITNNREGIHLFSAYNHTIRENSLKDNNHGIYLKSSGNNIIRQNNFTNNMHGMYMTRSSNNLLRNNSFSNNSYNFGVLGESLCMFIHDIDSSNTVNGKPVYYWVNHKNDVVPTDTGYLALINSTDITVKELNLKSNSEGVLLAYTENSLIANNSVTNNLHGIYICSSSNNTISGNNITANNYYGIVLEVSSNNTISGNNITNNRDGISLHRSSNNMLRNDSMTNNTYNFEVLGDTFSDLMNDVDASNTVDDKPVYYWVNRRDAAVPFDAGYVALVNCTSITVQNLNLTKNKPGILLAFTTNSTIAKNNITSNEYGIMLKSSSNNTISGNNITANKGADPGPKGGGVWLQVSSNNTISRNNITNNYWYGIRLDYSSNNTVYHNNFGDNIEQAASYGSTNVWDEGYPSGGNYWSDYTGVDLYSGLCQNETGSDGIGDTQYAIDVWRASVDNFPLMSPISTFDAGIWDGASHSIDVLSNSTVSDFELNETEKIIGFNVTGEAGSGFCRVTIPNIIIQGMWQGNYTVLVNGDPCPFTNWTDTENTYIYFTYLHSEHEVIIIPELSSALILPLLMIFTLVAATLSNKKRH